MLMTEKEELQKNVRNLNEEVTAHKTHIRSLRERVSALFQQDFSEDAKVRFGYFSSVELVK